MVIGTGNHYTIDILVGALIVVATHLISTHLSSRRLMWGNASRDDLIDLRQPSSRITVPTGLGLPRRLGPVDLRGPRR